MVLSDKTIECSNIEALSTAQALFPVAIDNCDSDVTNIEKIAGEFVGNDLYFLWHSWIFGTWDGEPKWAW